VNLPNKSTPTFEIASNKKLKLYNSYIPTKNSASSSDTLVEEISLNKNQFVRSQPELESDEGRVKSSTIFYSNNHFISIVSCNL